MGNCNLGNTRTASFTGPRGAIELKIRQVNRRPDHARNQDAMMTVVGLA
jgi:hypothetical protein